MVFIDWCGFNTILLLEHSSSLQIEIVSCLTMTRNSKQPFRIATAMDIYIDHLKWHIKNFAVANCHCNSRLETVITNWHCKFPLNLSRQSNNSTSFLPLRIAITTLYVTCNRNSRWQLWIDIAVAVCYGHLQLQFNGNTNHCSTLLLWSAIVVAIWKVHLQWSFLKAVYNSPL